MGAAPEEANDLTPRCGAIRVTWTGTFEPDFWRNRKLARLLDLCAIQPLVVREQVWGPDRIALATGSRWRLVLLALVKYPRLLVRLAISSAPDLYLVSYPGWFDVPLVRLVAWFKRRPVVFDPFISLHDTMIGDRRLHSRRSLPALVAWHVDRWSLRLADFVVADTPANLDFYNALAAGTRSKGFVVAVGSQDDVFTPLTHVEVDPRLVIFHGSLVPLQGVVTIAQAAALLEREGVRVEIIGDGQDRPALEAEIRRSGVSVELPGFVPLDQLPERLARAAVCLGIFGDSEKANRVVPHKLYDCLAMGRPVITRESEAVRSLFEEGELVTVPPADPESLAAAIRALIEDPGRRETVADAGYAAYRERFHENRLAEALCVALRSSAVGEPEQPGAGSPKEDIHGASAR